MAKTPSYPPLSASQLIDEWLANSKTSNLLEAPEVKQEIVELVRNAWNQGFHTALICVEDNDE
jgi:hypothetical protein